MSSEEHRLKIIVEDGSYYTKCLRVYYKYSREYASLLKWAETGFMERVVEKLPALDQQKSLKILGIGTGTGEIDFKLISQMLRKYPHILSTVVEPAESPLAQFQERAANEKWDGVEWDWRKQTWEEFSQKSKSNPGVPAKYHFISASHCIYYIEKWEAALLDMIDSLEEGGVLMVLVISDETGSRTVWDRVPVLGEKLTKLPSTEMKAFLGKNKLDFEEVYHQSDIDITCAYEEGNADGVFMTDFLTHVIDFKKTAPADLVGEVMMCYRGPDCSVQKGDRILLNAGWQMYLIKKGK